jgi:predicted RNA-binding protein with PIN domain
MQHVLIDGYNLMHALGFVNPRTKSAGLVAARRRFLDYVAERVHGRDLHVAVVFDASNAPPHVEAETQYRGMTVYSAKHQEADDLIEELIHRQAAPKQLVVVSNDRRLRKAAERRRCGYLRSDAFLDWLDRVGEGRDAPPRAEAGEKALPTHSLEEWLREFGHLDQDSTLGKPFHQPDEFGEEE